MRRPGIVCLFAAAMGVLEAAVVVYLRRIYYPGGFGFPLAPMEASILRIEVIREAMTILMLVCVALLAADRAWPRLMAFIVAFGVWDIAYYAGLKAFLDWPASLLAPDILFLIPRVWVGPVLAPILVSAAWVTGGLLLHRARLRIRPSEWVAAVIAAATVLVSFLIPGQAAAAPRFAWTLFGFGYLLGLILISLWVVRARRA